MIPIDPTIITARLDAGTLTRRAWRDTDADGRERACLLAALAPECGYQESADVCPADVMPAWLAELTPWIDDAGSDAAWPGVVRRYAAVAARWHRLDAETWRRLDYRVRALAVREAMRHTDHVDMLAACERVASLCERAAAGGEVGSKEWAAARETVSWAAEEAAEAAGTAAWAASRETAEEAAAEAAEAAVRAAEVGAAEAAGTEAEAAVRAAEAWAEAAARLIGQIFGALEQACDGAEVSPLIVM
jgi:hypothetical protein